MVCCGRQRQQFVGVAVATQRLGPATAHPPQTGPVRHSSVFFEYIGKTGLTVIGPVSGRRYHFDRPGSRLPVDPADKPSLAALPQLRQVAEP